ncbi:MAG TPA: tetratricopeptide repeat protein [Rhizomicrobium sp.]|nr:tetratricopeptide repeat protein [Rhizomicrobium sp.]
MSMNKQAAIAAVLLSAVAATALPSRSADLGEARQLLARGQAPAVYAMLAPEITRQAGNPDFDYLLGMAAVDSGRPAEAVAAFERVLAVRPDQLQARAELGRAYIAMNEPEAARRELGVVQQQPSIPPAVRRTLDRYVNALDTSLSGGGTRVSGQVSLSGGYDSNVNNSTSEPRILIPAFAALGYATLSPSAVAQEDGFAQAAGRLSVVHGLSVNQRLVADFTGSYRVNGAQDAFNQGLLGATIGFAHVTPDDGTFTISGQAQAYFVGGKDYRNAFGALGQWTFRRGEYDLGLYAQYLKLAYPSNAPQDADRYALGVTLGREIQSAWPSYLFGSVYGGQEITENPAFDNLSYTYAGARLGLEMKATPDLSIIPSLAVETNQYLAAEPLFLKTRDTLRTDLDVTVRYRINPQLSLGVNVTYTNANSNIPLYDFERVATMLTLSRDF